MSDEMRDDSEKQQEERPRRITLTGRRFGRVSFELQQSDEPPEESMSSGPARRTTGERRRAG